MATEKEPGISQLESLEIIQSMINKAKNNFSENGHLYLLWGWVVLVCSITEFVLLQINYEKHYLVWMLCWAAFIYQAIFLARKRRQKTVQTYTHDILKYVWLVFIIIMFLMGFLFGAILGGEYYKMITPGFLAIYGMPTFLSGIILRFKPLIIGGISCWVLSIVSTLIPPEYNLLLVAAAMIVAWIIPGYLLRSRFRKSTM